MRVLPILLLILSLVFPEIACGRQADDEGYYSFVNGSSRAMHESSNSKSDNRASKKHSDDGYYSFVNQPCPDKAEADVHPSVAAIDRTHRSHGGYCDTIVNADSKERKNDSAKKALSFVAVGTDKPECTPANKVNDAPKLRRKSRAARTLDTPVSSSSSFEKLLSKRRSITLVVENSKAGATAPIVDGHPMEQATLTPVPPLKPLTAGIEVLSQVPVPLVSTVSQKFEKTHKAQRRRLTLKWITELAEKHQEVRGQSVRVAPSNPEPASPAAKPEAATATSKEAVAATLTKAERVNLPPKPTTRPRPLMVSVRLSKDAQAELDADRAINLREGDMIVAAATGSTVKVGNCRINLKKNAVVFVSYRQGALKVCNLYDDKPDSIELSANDGSIALSVGAGQELVEAELLDTIIEAVSSDAVQRRALKSFQVAGGNCFLLCEYAPVSLMESCSLLRAVSTGGTTRDKLIIDRILRMAACVQIATASHGNYLPVAR